MMMMTECLVSLHIDCALENPSQPSLLPIVYNYLT